MTVKNTHPKIAAISCNTSDIFELLPMSRFHLLSKIGKIRQTHQDSSTRLWFKKKTFFCTLLKWCSANVYSTERPLHTPGKFLLSLLSFHCTFSSQWLLLRCQTSKKKSLTFSLSPTAVIHLWPQHSNSIFHLHLVNHSSLQLKQENKTCDYYTLLKVFLPNIMSITRHYHLYSL